MNRVLKSLLPSLAVFATVEASALPQINGSIYFEGSFEISGTSLLAFFIDPASDPTHSFTSFSASVANSPAPTGTYAGTAGQSVDFIPFDFVTLGAPLIPLWQFTHTDTGITYAFDGELVQQLLGFDESFELGGPGTAYVTGYAPTPGTWLLKGQFEGTAAQLSFFTGSTSAEGEPNAVPDGGLSLSLLGLTLLGLEGLRRKLNAK